MKNFIINLLIPILTFAVGVGTYRFSTPSVSLETISNYTAFYDGMNVEVESYIQFISPEDFETLFLTDFDNRSKGGASIDLLDSSVNLNVLQNQLKTNFTEKRFRRVKVLVKGTVNDDCKINYNDGAKISFGCCFGRSITIKAQEVIQIAPVEDYIRPQ